MRRVDSTISPSEEPARARGRVVRTSGGARSRAAELLRPSFAIVPAAVVAMLAAHALAPPAAAYDPPWLILSGNALFITGVAVWIALVAWRSFAATGRLQLVLLGSGVLVFGLAAGVAALVRPLPGGANLNVTVYNLGALTGGVLHALAAFVLLTGATPEAPVPGRRAVAALAYAGAAVLVAAITAAAVQGLLPVFFVQGVGATAVRQRVLGGSQGLFLFSFVVFLGTYLRTREVLLYWYACGLALTATSLTAFLLQRSVGSPVGWIGRLAQYVAGAYLLVSLREAGRSAQRRATSLDHVLTGSLSGRDESFRALAENSPDAIRRFDRALAHVYVNAAGQRLYGRAASDVIGRRVEEVGLEREAAARWADRLRTVFETGRPLEVEEEVPAEGGARCYQSRCVPELDPDGSVAHVLVVSRDLTERKRGEEALRASEERFRTAVETMQDGFVIFTPVRDGRGRIVDLRYAYINEAGARSNGLPRAAHEGRTVLELLPAHRDLPIWKDYLRVAEEGGTLAAESLVYEDVFGGERLQRAFDVRASRLGEGLALIWRDVTERHRAERALQESEARLIEADQRKNEFLAVLSHELRNPLSPIRNSLYVLARAAPGGEQARRSLEIIDRQVMHLSNLVDDLLDVTRVARNKIQLEREPLELDEVVRGAVEDNRTVFEQAGVALQLDPCPLPLPVSADRTRLAQIVGNLLQNAAKFTARGGHTRVTLGREGGEAVLRVSDDGIGMAPETLARLFQPFMQATQTLERSRGGLGLGLALVKGLVELHGGRIAASSAGLGRGSEFVVRLPLDDRVPPRRDPRRPVAPKPRRVLLVEDNPDAADSLAQLLELAGHEVAVARTGPEGLERALALRPDVVLCDIGLPGMDGYAVARSIRGDVRGKDLCLVALSGYALPEDLERAREAGFARHLSKPPVLEDVEAVLRELPRPAGAV